MDIADIKEIPIKGSNKAFKILIPADMAETVKYIWPEEIKAEPFREGGVSAIKPGGRGNNSNKQGQKPRMQTTFHRPPYKRNVHNHREYPYDYYHDYHRGWNSQPERFYRQPYYM